MSSTGWILLFWALVWFAMGIFSTLLTEGILGA